MLVVVRSNCIIKRLMHAQKILGFVSGNTSKDCFSEIEPFVHNCMYRGAMEPSSCKGGGAGGGSTSWAVCGGKGVWSRRDCVVRECYKRRYKGGAVLLKDSGGVAGRGTWRAILAVWWPRMEGSNHASQGRWTTEPTGRVIELESD